MNHVVSESVINLLEWAHLIGRFICEPPFKISKQKIAGSNISTESYGISSLLLLTSTL